MTVAELIEELKKWPQDLPVKLHNDEDDDPMAPDLVEITASYSCGSCIVLDSDFSIT